MRAPNPLPTSLAAVFSTVEARRLGVGSRRLRQPDVERLVHGRYHRANANDSVRWREHPHEAWKRRQRDRARALAPHLVSGAFYIEETAAALWGLPVMPSARLDDCLSVGSHLPATGMRGSALHARRLAERLAPVTAVEGVPVTSPATTWAMLAPRLTLDDAVALGDAVVHRSRWPGSDRLRRPPLATREDLEYAAMAPRRRGRSVLLTALELISERSASPPETLLRLRLREWGFPEPELDYDVSTPEGLLVGCSEVAYPELKLAIEYEGAHHLRDRGQWNRDIEKYQLYAQIGWEAIRVTAEMLHRNQLALRAIVQEALLRRGWRP